MKRRTEALTHSCCGDYVQLTASGLNKKNIKKGDYSYYENKNRDHSTTKSTISKITYRETTITINRESTLINDVNLQSYLSKQGTMRIHT